MGYSLQQNFFILSYSIAPSKYLFHFISKAAEVEMFMISSLFTKFRLVGKRLLIFRRCDVLYLLHGGLLALSQLMLHKTLVSMLAFSGYVTPLYIAGF